MKKVYQVIHLLRFQILSSIFKDASAKTPGFPIFLALIMLLIMPFLLAHENETTIGRTATTTLFESTNDSFRVQVPKGWVVQDVNNTGSLLAAEVTQGYGILAQLCPVATGQDGVQQQGAITDVSGTRSSGSCQQQSQGEMIHIIRYPNLGPRLGITANDIMDTVPDSVLQYEIHKLQEVGYRDINIVNSTYIPINVHYNTTFTGEMPAAQVTVPGRFVEITYSTASAPNEIREGYLILTATNATPPNLETITGYSIFYEGAPAAKAQQTVTPAPPGTKPVPVPVALAFGSFELIPSEEAVRDIRSAIVAQQAVSIANDQGEEANQPTSATQYLDTTTVMFIIVYSLLVIGVVWKFISYMRRPYLKVE
jgi:hypothetical protein